MVPAVVQSAGMCVERCPYKGCGQRCTGGVGHSFIRTAGRGLASLHACRSHVWATLAEACEVERSNARLNRKECVEAGVGKCAKCRGIVERLGS